MKRRGNSLFKRLTSKATAINNGNLSRTGEATREILGSPSQDNRILLGWLGYPARRRYNLQSGSAPIFWWPLDINVVEALLFKRFMAMTFYNPAFLISNLRNAGLEVLIGPNAEIQIWKSAGEKRYEFKGMPYFLGLVQGYLVPDEMVANIICKFLESVETAELPHQTSVDLYFGFDFP